jgi:multiple sugar transport system ATP-binding protein
VAEVRLWDVHVRHPRAATDTLTGIDLAVPDGSRLVLLGGSGSGKTTLLRAVAGLVPVTGGRITFDERDVTTLPPEDRDVAMVHEHGTLQPHLDVRRNLGFSLRMRRTPLAEERRRVEAEARAFALTDLLDRRPGALSEGERHEVALARSLVRRSAVLLLDEPFARLDAHRQTALRRELTALQAGYELTCLLATNDPVTAHAFADQVAVLDRGRLLQAGPPGELAAAPAVTRVAELLIVPAVNLLPGTVDRRNAGDLLLAGPLRIPLRRRLPHRVTVGVRPHDVTVTAAAGDVPVRRRVVIGHEVELTVGRAGDPPLRLLTDRDAPPEGARVALRVPPDRVHVFDATSGLALGHGV